MWRDEKRKQLKFIHENIFLAFAIQNIFAALTLFVVRRRQRRRRRRKQWWRIRDDSDMEFKWTWLLRSQERRLPFEFAIFRTLIKHSILRQNQMKPLCETKLRRSIARKIMNICYFQIMLRHKSRENVCCGLQTRRIVWSILTASWCSIVKWIFHLHATFHFHLTINIYCLFSQIENACRCIQKSKTESIVHRLLSHKNTSNAWLRSFWRLSYAQFLYLFVIYLTK